MLRNIFFVGCIVTGLAVVPATAKPALACGNIDNAKALLGEGRIVLLGEMHGTREAPAFAADVACHAVAAGHGVTVGLELPQDDQKRLDRFLNSDGKPGDFEALWSTFWTRSYQDGRASKAMSGLIDDLRKLRKAGHPVDVVLIDRPEVGPSGGRDQAMAQRLAEAHQEHPKNMLVALTGNMHNRTVPGAPWNKSYEPMGYLLQKFLPDDPILSLDMSYTGGTAWVCLSGEPCKVQPLGGRGKAETRSVTLREAVDAKGFHGVYDVGAIQASLPAARVVLKSQD